MKRIASADNPKYKSLLKLAQNARERKRQNKTLLDGIHLIAAYRDHRGKPELVAVSDSGLENPEILALLESLNPLQLVILSDGLLKRLSPVETPAGIIAVITQTKPGALKHTEPCVLLENIQDAGNIGSILRSAAASGMREVFISSHSVDVWSPRALRAGMGAHFLLHIREDSDLVRIARGFKGKVLATNQNAKSSLFNTDLRGTVAFAFGNEGGGLSQELTKEAGEIIAIPMAKGTESINVAASAAICLFEWVRQNDKTK